MNMQMEIFCAETGACSIRKLQHNSVAILWKGFRTSILPQHELLNSQQHTNSKSKEIAKHVSWFGYFLANLLNVQ